jgi:hypothetical protein
MSGMHDEHPVRTGKLLIWYALGIRLTHVRSCAHAHLFCNPLISALSRRVSTHDRGRRSIVARRINH